MKNNLNKRALDYHMYPSSGKISVNPTKPLSNQDDLSLAYSPGVAVPCMEIYEHGDIAAAKYTSRANLVGVISNGTAVLGLGDIGPLASKPVMEGKGCLFKKFAGIDVFDIELNEKDPDKLVDIIAALEPTLGGINLEDIKAPECFYIEKKLKEKVKIPVFHDDQHGTAIISSAAILNGLKVLDKDLKNVKIACSGAGAAAIACLDLLVKLGAKVENIYVADSKGVIWDGRDSNMEITKKRYAQKTSDRTLSDIIKGADVFLGCSKAKVLTQEMVKTMAPKPLILALANPEPEILPNLAKEARPDCIIATGRSDFPNQVNNVLCFPFIFRGALDCGATHITEEMKLACVKAIAKLAQEEQNDEVALAYAGQNLTFGPEYIIPKPFDPRLIVYIASAVAQSASESGVATRPIQNIEEYKQKLMSYVYRSGQTMLPIFSQAKKDPKRVIYADGEDEKVIRAVQNIVDEKLAYPILIGRNDVITATISRLGLRIKVDQDIKIIDPETNFKCKDMWKDYYDLKKRIGVTPDIARSMIRKHNTIIGAMLLRKGDGDALLCGVSSKYDNQLKYVDDIIKKKDGQTYAALNVLLLQDQILFITDTHVNENPTSEEIANITIQAAKQVKKFGLIPKIALLSNSNFGSKSNESAKKMSLAVSIIKNISPDLEVDGEMHADAALSENIRKISMPDSQLTGKANLLVMPNLDAGNISYNLVKMIGGAGVTIGPILLGSSRPVHILTNTTTVRRIVNMTALAVIDAQQECIEISKKL
ncbi:NADP-dependent malic enzyme [Candidatus Kinetoplastibacterium sorsogonicusi]|uniref:NADP-dependent malic enzyme n=1 Tax=Candidatus Kinetoplastidibacterium kentomonadis TaxID=1576550 RepID=A0A3Q8F6Q3_9PROT|nr:NADP-dependent malic enzyme [Candidatus Kinetoplastibacterium sorsogonicusi]AWD32540.1 NADP-dependent malic enzyme [Candidatus Kinetoplastibacterium sorsogonicusi]